MSTSSENQGSSAGAVSSGSLLSKLTDKSNFPTQSCSIKLDRTNYPLWLTHVLPVVKGYKLEGFINGTKPCPTQFVAEKDEVTINPAFEDWVSSDQLLFGWLLNTMSLEISAEMTGVTTSAGLWTAAKQIAGVQTKSRLLMLRSEMQRTRKGSMRMVEYLSKLRSIADQLAMARSSVPLPDLVIQALAGLDGDYNPVVVQLSQQAESLTWIELQTSLLTFESRLEQLAQFSNLSISGNSFANIARSDGFSNFRNNGQRGGRNRGRRGRMFNTRRPGRNDSTPICQLCTKVGHTVETCFHRYDRTFVSPSSRGRGFTSMGKRSPMSYDSDGAYWASLEMVADDSWYMDSGTTSHITNDLNKLETSTDLTDTGNRGDAIAGKNK